MIIGHQHLHLHSFDKGGKFSKLVDHYTKPDLHVLGKVLTELEFSRKRYPMYSSNFQVDKGIQSSVNIKARNTKVH